MKIGKGRTKLTIATKKNELGFRKERKWTRKTARPLSSSRKQPFIHIALEERRNLDTAPKGRPYEKRNSEKVLRRNALERPPIGRFDKDGVLVPGN